MGSYELPTELREALIAELSKFADNYEVAEAGTLVHRPGPSGDCSGKYGYDEVSGWIGVKVFYRIKKRASDAAPA